MLLGTGKDPEARCILATSQQCQAEACAQSSHPARSLYVLENMLWKLKYLINSKQQLIRMIFKY